MFLCPHQWEVSKRPGKLGCLVVSLRCLLRTHPHMYHQRSEPSHPPAPACQTCGPLVIHALCNHAENLSENLLSCTYLKDARSGVHYSCGTCVPLQLQMHINPGLLDSKDTTPLLRPLVESHCGGFSLCPLDVNFIMTLTGFN